MTFPSHTRDLMPLTDSEGDKEFGMDSLGLDVFDALLEGDPDSEPVEIDGRGDSTCNAKGDTTGEADSSRTAVPSEGQAQVVSTPRHTDRPTSCVYKGFLCRCIADDHPYDSSLPSISVAQQLAFSH